MTLDELVNFLNRGQSLTDVSSMIEILRSYESEVLTRIDDWETLIPHGWGRFKDIDRKRLKDFKTVVTWLLRLGYDVRHPYLKPDDVAIWQILKDKSVGRLHWECERFFVEGLPKPQESSNDTDRMPKCLSCWE